MLPELTTYSVVRLRISILCGVGEIVRLSVTFAEDLINFDFEINTFLENKFQLPIVNIRLGKTCL